MSSVKLDNLRKSFGAVPVLKGISIVAEPKDFLVLLGPSGCGKSTLLAIIAGLESCTEGTISIDNVVMNNVHPKDRDVSMVFQSYALYPTMTVERNITFALEMRGIAKAERKAAAVAAAEVLHITHLLDRKPGQLSGGQRQRVAMGRALVRQPKVFLFDEPLSNLDAQLRGEMRSEIRRLHARVGATTIYVTHDQIEAMTMANKIAVLKDGELQQFGTPDDIYERPANLFVAGFVGSPQMNFVDARVCIDGAQSYVELAEKARLPLRIEGGQDVKNGTSVVIGIRPECVTVAMGSEADSLLADCRILSLEATGADAMAIASLYGTPITARLRPQQVRGLDRIRLAIAYSDLHFFDKATSQRLRTQADAVGLKLKDDERRPRAF
jgi:multiple sugar transport system ATP-binding protein